jgi:hypothetical protein
MTSHFRDKIAFAINQEYPETTDSFKTVAASIFSFALYIIYGFSFFMGIYIIHQFIETFEDDVFTRDNYIMFVLSTGGLLQAIFSASHMFDIIFGIKYRVTPYVMEVIDTKFLLTSDVLAFIVLVFGAPSPYIYSIGMGWLIAYHGGMIFFMTIMLIIMLKLKNNKIKK